MKFRLGIPASFQLVDWWLYLVPVLITGVGLAVITSLTYGTDRISLVTSQALYAVIGIVIMLLISRVDYRAWRASAGWLYLFGLIGLILVSLLGVTIFGAERWLAIGSFQLQPAEFMKLLLVLVLARFLAGREELAWHDYLMLLFLIGLPLIFILKQPDLGTAIILVVGSIALLIAAGLPRQILAGGTITCLLTLPVIWQLLQPYQRERLLTFLDPGADRYGAGYNVLQALIAVGSGGLLGNGLGKGSQSQLQFLPVAHTDFIFAGVAEATGLVGSLALLALLLFLILRVIRVAQVAKDRFGMLAAIGIASLLLVQVVINVGMNIGLMPVTGIPLPFVSHGGSALITNFLAIGILQSIYIRHRKITF